MPHTNNESQVVQMRQQITDEYIAAKWGLSGLAAGFSKHQYITVRQERIGDLHMQLRAVVGAEQAIQIVAETLANLPEQGNRESLIRTLLQELGESEETQHLIDWIRDLWETVDILVERFGEETVAKIVHAPGITPFVAKEQDSAEPSPTLIS